MKKLTLLILLLVSALSFSQEGPQEIDYKLFVQPDSVDVPDAKKTIGTEKWDTDLNVSKKWDGENWVYDDAIIFRDAGFGFAAIDRRGASFGGMNMGPIGDFAFDISVNWYRDDLPGAVGDLSFTAGADNKATGYASVAFGYTNTADAHYAFVAGVNNEIGGGGASAALGAGLDADGAASIVVVGEANVAPESIGIGPQTEWDFLVGIGWTDGSGQVVSRKNGFGVSKSGNGYFFSATPSSIASHAKTAVTYDFIAGDIPASATATGSKGQIATDANFIYVCVATDTWVRAPLSTW